MGHFTLRSSFGSFVVGILDGFVVSGENPLARDEKFKRQIFGLPCEKSRPGKALRFFLRFWMNSAPSCGGFVNILTLHATFQTPYTVLRFSKLSSNSVLTVAGLDWIGDATPACRTMDLLYLSI